MSIRSQINSHRLLINICQQQVPNIMFACSRQPSGVSNIMAIDESKEAYNHVVRVLLDAAIDSPINLLLRADNCTSIARLRQLIKIPGLHERSELFRGRHNPECSAYLAISYGLGHWERKPKNQEPPSYLARRRIDDFALKEYSSCIARPEREHIPT